MTGRYKAYPEYKDSGVEWVGKIPSHWGLKKLKYLAPLISEKAKGKTNPIALEHIQSWTGKLISTDSKFDGDGTKFKAGDILFGKLRPYLAKVYLTEEDGEAIGDFHVMRPINSSYGKFLKSLMLTTDYISTVDASTYGAKMPRASWDFTSNIQLPFCSETEAEKIGSFLDHETAKIDSLIAKQEKLIELLKEKRQAVISHAVTKGLNPDAPMKDSGVEWLGEVPEHWDVTPLKHLCRFSGGGTPTKDNLSYWTNGTIPWVSPKDMKSLRVTQTCDYITEKAVVESSTNYVDSGVLLMVVRSGILQRTIPVAINDVVVTLNQDMKALKFNNKMAVDFALYFIVGNEKALLLEWSKEGATVESIEHEYLANGLLSVPPLSEQLSIVQYLSAEMEKFSQLETKASLGIELLKERKTALISAAVTGKIDVRDFVAEQEQPHGVQG